MGYTLGKGETYLERDGHPLVLRGHRLQLPILWDGFHDEPGERNLWGEKGVGEATISYSLDVIVDESIKHLNYQPHMTISGFSFSLALSAEI